MITFCISTYNNLEYLKLAVKSVRENAYFKDAPFIIHAENCTDGTNEWLDQVKTQYDLTTYIEPHVDPSRGIGGGMNFCASKVKTSYIIFLQSDFYVARNFDLELLNEYKGHKHIVSSWRMQPNIFNNPPYKPGNLFFELNDFGGYYDDFNFDNFLNFADEFSELNNHQIRRCEGAGGFIISKEDWDYIGGNDSLFAPTSWDDIDLFVRMQNEEFIFTQTTKSVIWHFAGRGSHRLEENNGKSSERQQKTEQVNALKFYNKWGQMPQFDDNDFVKPIASNKNRMSYNIELNTSEYI
jgi:glycosyltransferase involved in cell wall biosynthesis